MEIKKFLMDNLRLFQLKERSRDGIHVHLTIADTDGAVYGGHLLEGCIVHTTAEIGIIKSKKIFKRIYDPKTGYKELFVQDNQS